MLYERQKILLALVEGLGGRAQALDLRNLLFLHARSGPQPPPYEFVPAGQGAFSFTLCADLRKLEEQGLLGEDGGAWTLREAGEQVLAEPRCAGSRARVRAFLSESTPLRGDELSALTYRTEPFIAIRSANAASLLAAEPESLARIVAARPARGSAGLVTIGYEGRSLENYLAALLREAVTLLCDVRRNPLSRRFGFSRATLSNACLELGLRYEHLPELGIASAERQAASTPSDHDELFARYVRVTLPREKPSQERIAAWISAGERVTLTCFERLPEHCHRSRLATALAESHPACRAPRHL